MRSFHEPPRTVMIEKSLRLKEVRVHIRRESSDHVSNLNQKPWPSVSAEVTEEARCDKTKGCEMPGMQDMRGCSDLGLQSPGAPNGTK